MREDGPNVNAAAAGAQIGGAIGKVAAGKTQQTTGAGNIPMADANRDVTAEEQAKKKQDAAKAALQAQIDNGNATYVQTNVVGDIFGLVFDKKGGNYIDISGIPKGTTLGEVKRQYNLPDGSLRHMRIGGGGNFDNMTLDYGYVTIYVSDLKEGLGISDKDLKAMFPDSQFSPWYKMGTKE